MEIPGLNHHGDGGQGRRQRQSSAGSPRLVQPLTAELSQAVVHTVRQTFFMHDLTVLVCQVSRTGELHGCYRDRSRSTGLCFYREKQGVGGKLGDRHPYLIQMYIFAQYLGAGAE